ncbi:MAG: METTL5 family protein [Thermoplasmata archaeon]|nr:METTL5 family protein [Thermoplasmata archaeon]
MKQRVLEIRLQGLEGFANPKAKLEQYATPAKIAADILYTAHAFGDIESKSIIDLGCGTGVFSIGACLLGALEIVGLDIDAEALDAARRNAEKAGCDINFQCSKVDDISGKYDTCIMNPPFGSQTKHADIPFLDKAMELADVIYSLHNAETMDFLRTKIVKNDRIVQMERKYKMEIKHTFDFHTKDMAFFDVTMMRIVRP